MFTAKPWEKSRAWMEIIVIWIRSTGSLAALQIQLCRTDSFAFGNSFGYIDNSTFGCTGNSTPAQRIQLHINTGLIFSNKYCYCLWSWGLSWSTSLALSSLLYFEGVLITIIQVLINFFNPFFKFLSLHIIWSRLFSVLSFKGSFKLLFKASFELSDWLWWVELQVVYYWTLDFWDSDCWR